MTGVYLFNIKKKKTKTAVYRGLGITAANKMCRQYFAMSFQWQTVTE